MHALGFAGMAFQPCFFRREAQYRRQPGRQDVVEKEKRRARGPSAHGVAPVAVERVLANIEVEGRKVIGAKIVECPIKRLKVVRGERVSPDALQLVEAVQDPALEVGHGSHIDLFRIGEAGQVAEREAEGVPETTVGIRNAGEDLIADPEVAGAVAHRDPEPQDVRSLCVVDLLRAHDIAGALRHLAAVPVEDEPVREDAAVRRLSPGCRNLRVASCGTSRGAGRCLRGTGPPASAGPDCSRARTSGCSPNRTTRPGCHSCVRSRPDRGPAPGTPKAAA